MSSLTIMVLLYAYWLETLVSIPSSPRSFSPGNEFFIINLSTGSNKWLSEGSKGFAVSNKWLSEGSMVSNELLSEGSKGSILSNKLLSEGSVVINK